MRWLAFAISLALMTACHTKPEVVPSPPPRVIVTQAVSRDMPIFYETIGHVTAYQTATITPQVTGEILKVHVDDGAFVKEGELLFSIDPAMYQAAFDEATAQLALDAASVKLAQERVERYQKLVAAQYVSQLDYSTYQSQLAQAQAAADVDRARLRTAKLNLDWTQVKAPFSGRAGRVLLDEGNQAVAQSSKLLVINRLQPIYVRFSTPEVYLPRILRSQEEKPLEAEIEIPDTGAPLRRAPLAFVGETVATNTGTIPLEALDPNLDTGLWPGQYVKVRLLLDQLPNAVLIPESAVGQDAQGAYVFVVDEHQVATKRSIKVLAQSPTTLEGLDGLWVVALSGLRANEAVVSSGQQRLKSGMQVQANSP